MKKTYQLKVYRGNPGKQYWQIFELPLLPSANIISALMEIRKNPVTIDGKHVEPVVWEDGCLEEVCGSCSMLINGYPRQACTALIENLLKQGPIITVAPLTKFPLIRDLAVDRSPLFEHLKKVRAWIDCDGVFDRGPGPKISPKKQEVMYTLSTCMSCGCCSEACPQVSEKSKFIGPAAISQARLFNAHPNGQYFQRERISVLMQEGGISSCGNAQNCAAVCPKQIPLTESIAVIGRDALLETAKRFFSLNDR